MMIKRAEQIAIANAEEAFDQAYNFSSLEDSIASYFDNLRDTLVEEGMLNQRAHAAAERAFDKRVAELRSKAAKQ